MPKPTPIATFLPLSPSVIEAASLNQGKEIGIMNTTTFDLERGFSPMAPAMMITRDIASAMSVTPMIVGNPM